MLQLKPDKAGNVRLTVSPFLKVVLVVIAVALSLIAVRGFLKPEPLYAQSSSQMDVNIKSIGGWTVSGSLPIKITEYPYSALKVEVKE